jgi:imidazole glycerol-phosphate synthase subunit HisH
MNVIIDYGLGNIKSLSNWFNRADMPVIVSKDCEIIRNADVLILPGVGAFRDAIKRLEDQSFDQLIKEHVARNKPLIGICLGMQLLFERSFEHGMYKGLELLEGSIIPFESNVKVPHMGWNNLSGIPFFQGQDVYFVHSYYLETSKDIVIASSKYGVDVPGVVKENNVLGFQFHPEKSGDFGERIIEYVKEFANEYISCD